MQARFKACEILSWESAQKDGEPELLIRGKETYKANLNPENPLTEIIWPAAAVITESRATITALGWSVVRTQNLRAPACCEGVPATGQPAFEHPDSCDSRPFS